MRRGMTISLYSTGEISIIGILCAVLMFILEGVLKIGKSFAIAMEDNNRIGFKRKKKKVQSVSLQALSVT